METPGVMEGLTTAVSSVSGVVTSAFSLLMTPPVSYFVAAAALVVAISVAKRMIPMKRG